MSVRRIMGTETEYAVLASHGNPVQWSFDVIGQAAQPDSRHIRWDYGHEDPVNDMRGVRLPRAHAQSSMLTDAPQTQVTNVLVANGGRMYVDHAHPEYSSPETTNPFDAVKFDSAGDVLMQQAAERAGHGIALYKNNVDGKGASWGAHENYMMRRDVPFDVVSQLMTLHFVTRQIYTGAGRLGIGEHSEQAGYQLSQRADYVHMNVALQTTFDRPIINTRDEPHGPDDMRRLHVIVGDANRMDVPRVLKLGTTSMLLWVCEHAQEAQIDVAAWLDAHQFVDPVQAMHTVSHDMTLTQALPMTDGSELTAWQCQVQLYGLVYEIAGTLYDTDSRGEPLWPDTETRSVMAMWKQALLDVATIRHATSNSERLQLSSEASRVEWLCKWQLIERMRQRLYPESASRGMDDVRLAAIDLRWAALDPALSLFTRMQSHTERTCTDTEIAQAMTQPPIDTRAWLRGTMVQRFASELWAVSWTQITTQAVEPMPRLTLDMRNPWEYTQAQCAAIVEHSASADEVITTIQTTLNTQQS